MNKYILNTGIQEYINNNLNTDIMSVVLKKSPYKAVSSKELAEQIESKKRCQKKLPTWFNHENIYYPNKLNIEQCSSEITAEYKSNIVSGKSLIDLTGGLGIDSYYFSKNIDEITHCENNQNLSEIAKHNFNVLGSKNIKTQAKNGLDVLKNTNTEFDWIYIDPSRRNDIKGKVFKLSDCEPDILEHLELFLEKSKNIIVKTSPLLDLSLTINQIQFAQEIHIVAVNNEVKELLWLLKRINNPEVKIHTINVKNKTEEKYCFLKSEEHESSVQYALPKNYLYEPNSAILKAGAFKKISKDFSIFKLHEHTHLYTSDKFIDFPGRSFEVTLVSPYNKKVMKTLNQPQANITTRNFPLSVAAIRKAHKIKDGGNLFLFFTKNHLNELIIVHCKKTSI